MTSEKYFGEKNLRMKILISFLCNKLLSMKKYCDKFYLNLTPINVITSS